MRIELPDHHRAGLWIEFTALVTPNDARGNARLAHQHNKHIGIVLAKASPLLKQKLVDKVCALNRVRRQGVVEGLVAEPSEHRIDQCGIVGIVLPQSTHASAAAGVGLFGQREFVRTPPG